MVKETTPPTDSVEIVATPTKSLAGYNQQIGRKKRTPLKDFQVKILDSLELKGEHKIFVPNGIGKNKS